MTAAEIVGGMVLALFLLFFFLYDGQRITTWALRLFPRSIKDDVREAGLRAGAALAAYMRATILVASIDGFFIGLTLVLLGVPLAVPLAVLTFLGAFVPLIGATVTGAVAVLVALVSNGVPTALLVLAAVLAVQQLEGNVLAPLILGKALSLHPVAIALVVAVGALLAGIAGAVVAVPLTAVTHAVVTYFLTDPGRSPARPPG